MSDQSVTEHILNKIVYGHLFKHFKTQIHIGSKINE